MTALQLAIVLMLGWPAFAFLFIAAWTVRRPVPPTMLVGRHRRRDDGWPGGEREHVDGIW